MARLEFYIQRPLTVRLEFLVITIVVIGGHFINGLQESKTTSKPIPTNIGSILTLQPR
jgi:hypothetical protein